MQSHMLYVRAQVGNNRPSLKAHAEFSCSYAKLKNSISKHYNNLKKLWS